jgi:MFS family permease
MKHYQDRFVGGSDLGDGTSIIFSICTCIVYAWLKLFLTLCIDTVGGIVGPWFAGPLTDRFGRRGGMFIGG